MEAISGKEKHTENKGEFLPELPNPAASPVPVSIFVPDNSENSLEVQSGTVEMGADDYEQTLSNPDPGEVGEKTVPDRGDVGESGQTPNDRASGNSMVHSNRVEENMVLELTIVTVSQDGLLPTKQFQIGPNVPFDQRPD
jgi:hypothetical protein